MIIHTQSLVLTLGSGHKDRSQRLRSCMGNRAEHTNWVGSGRCKKQPAAWDRLHRVRPLFWAILSMVVPNIGHYRQGHWDASRKKATTSRMCCTFNQGKILDHHSAILLCIWLARSILCSTLHDRRHGQSSCVPSSINIYSEQSTREGNPTSPTWSVSDLHNIITNMQTEKCLKP